MKTDKPIYEQWMDGNYPNPGGFELSLMETYQRGSESNRRKLRSVYPEYFGVELSDSIEFFKTQLDESDQVSLDIYHATKDTHVRIEGGEEGVKEFIRTRLMDGANAIDLYIILMASDTRRYKNLFFEILNEITL